MTGPDQGPDLPSLRLPSPERRDLAVKQLSDLFAAGRLELDDLETRMEIVMRAQTLADLDRAMAGLAAPEPPRSPVPAPNPPEFAVDHPRRRGSRVTFIMMGGVNRKGAWFPSKRHWGVALMGGAHLDFREAQLQPGVTHVHLFTMWGGIEVAVPEGIDVEVSGLAVMGGLERLEQVSASTDPRRPRLHVHAFALMGAIDVRVLKPGEVWKEDEAEPADDD